MSWNSGGGNMTIEHKNNINTKKKLEKGPYTW